MENIPAFPCAIEETNSGVRVIFQEGMTLRDYFAGHALAALSYVPGDWDRLAKNAYYIADAMLAERKRRINLDRGK